MHGAHLTCYLWHSISPSYQRFADDATLYIFVTSFRDIVHVRFIAIELAGCETSKRTYE